MQRINRLSIVCVALVALFPPAAIAAEKVDPVRLAAVLAKVDTSALGSAAAFQLPPGVLAYDALAALAPGAAGPALIGETFTPGPATPQGVTAQSTHWTYEWRPQRGGALLQLKEGMQSPLPPVPAGQQPLIDDALARLDAIGIPPALIGPVALRRLMTQSQNEDGGEPTPPTVAGFKVFVESSFVGQSPPVLVDGLRAVATYGVDRRLRKLLVYWPGLAEGGHDVESPITAAEAALVVARDLVQNDEDDVGDRVELEWVYATVPTGPGEVALDLQLQATLRDAPWNGGPEDVKGKIRVRQIEPDRFGAAFCDVETSEADYDSGESVQITRLRFANYTGAPLPARVRFQIVLPFGLAINAIDLNLTMPVEIDKNLAMTSPISLFTLGGQNPALLGDYEVRCRIEEPGTGTTLASDSETFHASDLGGGE